MNHFHCEEEHYYYQWKSVTRAKCRNMDPLFTCSSMLIREYKYFYHDFVVKVFTIHFEAKGNINPKQNTETEIRVDIEPNHRALLCMVLLRVWYEQWYIL